MRVSRRGLYALRALLHLAEEWGTGWVRTSEIAKKEGLPGKFLEAILLSLKNARIVTSRRGRAGGYRLRRPADEILVGEVIRLIDGPLAPIGDSAELAERVRTEERHAGLYELFLEVRDATSRILDHTSLQDLLARDRRILARRARAQRKVAS